MSLHRSDLLAMIRIIDATINGAAPSKTEADLFGLRQQLRLELTSLGPERGVKVFEWRLALFREKSITRGKNKGKVRKEKMAPTMNELVAMNIWERSAVRERLDQDLLEALKDWPNSILQDEKRPRSVRVTRSSHMPPDELGVDVLGGKVPIDRMVLAGVLAGDTAKVLHREARWVQAPKNEGTLLIEVFELREES
jgi:hypothetical protein